MGLTKNRFSKAKLIALTLTTILLARYTQAQKTGKNNKIGDYVIPKDQLQDNYCQKYDITKFHDIKDIQTKYRSFFLRKVEELRDPIYNFMKANKWVKKISKHFLKKILK